MRRTITALVATASIAAAGIAAPKPAEARCIGCWVGAGIAAAVIGGAIAGVFGAIFAVPITAAARDLFRYTFHRVDDPPATPEEAVARIRANPKVVETDSEPPAAPAAAAG